MLHSSPTTADTSMPSCSRCATAFGAYLAVTTTARPPRSVTAATASAAPGMATVRGMTMLGVSARYRAISCVDRGLVQAVPDELLLQRRTQPGDERPAVQRDSGFGGQDVEDLDDPRAGVDQGHVEVEADGETHSMRVSGLLDANRPMVQPEAGQ